MRSSNWVSLKEISWALQWQRVMLQTRGRALRLVSADERLKDIEFLKEELGLKLQLIMEETEELTTMQGRVVKALEASKEPLRVAVLCLEERSGLGGCWEGKCEKTLVLIASECLSFIDNHYRYTVF